MPRKRASSSSSSEDDIPLKIVKKNKSDEDNIPLKIVKKNNSDLYTPRDDKCEFCDAVFKNKYEILVHNAHHIIIPLIKQNVYECSKCPRVFPTREERSLHKETIHTKDKDRHKNKVEEGMKKLATENECKNKKERKNGSSHESEKSMEYDLAKHLFSKEVKIVLNNEDLKEKHAEINAKPNIENNGEKNEVSKTKYDKNKSKYENARDKVSKTNKVEDKHTNGGLSSTKCQVYGQKIIIGNKNCHVKNLHNENDEISDIDNDCDADNGVNYVSCDASDDNDINDVNDVIDISDSDEDMTMMEVYGVGNKKSTGAENHLQKQLAFAQKTVQESLIKVLNTPKGNVPSQNAQASNITVPQFQRINEIVPSIPGSQSIAGNMRITFQDHKSLQPPSIRNRLVFEADVDDLIEDNAEFILPDDNVPIFQNRIGVNEINKNIATGFQGTGPNKVNKNSTNVAIFQNNVGFNKNNNTGFQSTGLNKVKNATNVPIIQNSIGVTETKKYTSTGFQSTELIEVNKNSSTVDQVNQYQGSNPNDFQGRIVLGTRMTESYTPSIHYNELVKSGSYPCKTCGIVNINRYQSIVHTTTHMKLRSHLTPTPVCPFCDRYICGNHHILRKHIKQKHPTNIQKNFHSAKCYTCGLRYYSAFRHHTNYHLIYVCSTCGKRFMTETERTEHITNNHMYGPNVTPKYLFHVKDLVKPVIERSNVPAIEHYERVKKLCEICFLFLKNNHRKRYVHIGDYSEVGMLQKCEKCNKQSFEVKLVKYVAAFHKDCKRHKQIKSNADRLKNIKNRLKMFNKLIR